MGLGSALYALAKIDGVLQEAETATVKHILAQHPYGDIALSAYVYKEAFNAPAEQAYEFALRRFTANRNELDDDLKKQFIFILEQVALAHDDISRKESAFIRRFRRDIRRI